MSTDQRKLVSFNLKASTFGSCLILYQMESYFRLKLFGKKKQFSKILLLDLMLHIYK